MKTSLFSVSVCRAILFEMLLYIHLFICILDPSIAPHFIAFASLFVFLSSSYLRANLISNKIICSICGCFYSPIFFSWPVSKCFFYRANAIVEFVSKFVLYCTMLTTNEKKVVFRTKIVQIETTKAMDCALQIYGLCVCLCI